VPCFFSNLALDVVGRIAPVVTGLFSINAFRQTGAIVAGTTIVTIFAAYISDQAVNTRPKLVVEVEEDCREPNPV
jgi:hypothetical protein